MAEEERVREREPEPVPESHYEATIRERQRLAERMRNGRVLIRSDDVDFTLARQGRLKFYVTPEDATLPVLHWSVFIQDIRTHSGRHRHQGGACIYVLEGRGATEVDGLTVPWQAGDLILLPIKPGGVEHKHFNADPAVGCKWLAFIFKPRLLFDEMTQLEVSPMFAQEFGSAASLVTGAIENVGRAEAPDGRIPAEIRSRAAGLRPILSPEQRLGVNLFDWLAELRDVQRAMAQHQLWVIRGDELPWEANRHGSMRWYLHPALRYPALNQILLYEQELPPGGRSGRQRHPGNQVTYVRSGRGYTLIDGIRSDWGEGDVLCLPMRKEGTLFQHFNSDPEQPARLVVAEPNHVDVLGVDRGAGWEQMEDAPAQPAL